jgi:hypothetical protein
MFSFKALPKGDALVYQPKETNLEHTCGEAVFRNEKQSSIPAAFYANIVKPLCVSGNHFHFFIMINHTV